METKSKFAVGDRVIVTRSVEQVNGYYGHVAKIGAHQANRDFIWVSLEGHVSDPRMDRACRTMAEANTRPFPFFPEELDHAD